MTRFTLAFAPFLPLAVLAVMAVLAAVVAALGYRARRKGTTLRLVALALVILALADPSFVREDREGLKDVVAVVLDQSGSQTIGERMAQTARARAAIEKGLAALGNVEARFIESSRTDAENDGTHLFAALNAGLGDVPPDHVAGAIMVTDGLVDDIPASADLLGFKAPAARPRHGPRGRAGSPNRTRRGAPLRHRGQGPDDWLAGARHRRQGRAGQPDRQPATASRSRPCRRGSEPVST